MSNGELKVDIYGRFGLIQTPDGSFTRMPDHMPATPAGGDSSDPIPVLTKDIPINEEKNTWARLFLPQLPESHGATKLPLIVYFHGGGFVIGSAASTLFQKVCCNIVRHTPAVMVSVEYRLAPEHRLPAAYDDCIEALHWIKTTADEWLTKHSDFSKSFLMGASAGGNIVYHIGLRVVACLDQLAPLKIQGLILQQPFFGGVERTKSEIRLVNDKILPQDVVDILWDLALPVGVDRDHEYCNPTTDIKVELMKKMKDQGWRILVTGNGGDPFIDRQIEFAKILKENGVEVVEYFVDEGCHGIAYFDDSFAILFYNRFKEFLSKY